MKAFFSRKAILSSVAAVSAIAGIGAPARSALVFDLTFTPGTSAQAKQGFVDAAARWSSIFTDNIHVALTVGTASLNPGILGQAASNQNTYSFSTFKAALAADKTSSADTTAVASMPGGSSFSMLINGTTDGLSPHVDSSGANNQTIDMTTANAKALGLGVSGKATGCLTATCDGFIQFSTNFGFDYDPTDGITAGLYDFVGVATHEIGHALGFISGVDVLDFNFGPFRDDQFTFVTSLRHSTLSEQSGADIDWTADARSKYFSVDGGATSAGCTFSTGSSHGDGRQASHWKDNLGCGIMDPTAAPGEKLAISGLDTLALDVIGWDIKRVTPPPAVPETSTWAMMILGFGFAGAAMRRRRTSIRFA